MYELNFYISCECVYSCVTNVPNVGLNLDWQENTPAVFQLCSMLKINK